MAEKIISSKLAGDPFWTMAHILEATGGDAFGGDERHSFSGTSIDSRTIKEDELFIAIQGDVHDGHDFIQDVVAKGVRGILIRADKANRLNLNDNKTNGVLVISVPDTFKALGDLALYRRKKSNVSVVGITGSNGKTSTREMTASIVSQQFNTLSTSGNFNNEIGLPLTLLRLTDSHEWAILELAMNKPGEIKRLAGICMPDVGLVTNIGPAHLEGLGSIEGVMHAKGELLEALRPHGTAVLNADDPMTQHLEKKTSADILFFGLSEKAHMRAENINEAKNGIRFTLKSPTEEFPVHLNVHGQFMVSNALAAAAVAYHLGISSENIQQGLKRFTPVQGRMNIIDTKNHIHIIDDTYNANPGSMAAAIQTLCALKNKKNRAIVVAGDMRELGENSSVLHNQIGTVAAKLKIDKLCITGEFAEAVEAGAREANMDAKDIFIGSKEEIIRHLVNSLQPDDWVLVKGSRAMGMEKIVSGVQHYFNTI